MTLRVGGGRSPPTPPLLPQHGLAPMELRLTPLSNPRPTLKFLDQPPVYYVPQRKGVCMSIVLVAKG